METISFKTKDGVIISADWYPVKGKRASLLLHMMPSTKESWHDFAPLLVGQNIAVLAIDGRGHGESQKQEGRDELLDYTRFSDEEHQAKYQDIEAAVAWLSEHGYEVSIVVGASIGANLALWWQVENFNVRSTVLLSPGFNYRGIDAKSLMKKISAGQRTFIVGAKGDERSGGNTAADMALVLSGEMTSAEVELYISEASAHGTDMFDTDEDLMRRIVEWIAK